MNTSISGQVLYIKTVTLDCGAIQMICYYNRGIFIMLLLFIIQKCQLGSYILVTYMVHADYNVIIPLLPS